MTGENEERPLRGLYHAVLTRRLPLSPPVSDDALGEHQAEIFEATESLAGLPAEDLEDVIIKLEVLCGRLYDELQLAYSGDVLTWYLAEGIRQDLRTLTAVVWSASDGDQAAQGKRVPGRRGPVRRAGSSGPQSGRSPRTR
ncbi:MAG: hypothetical protein ACK4NA_03070 [Alphaproteobacteria bacterium]